ncbi:MAG: ferredoxin oxidoreductase [Thaumarchaeota archaeon]|nr:ferredoxin oxidoreductase [Nitrososphaerota archaeon]
MTSRLGLSGNTAAAYAVRQLDVDVVPVYPITPSTTIMETLAQYAADGRMDAEIITVESEHSAISAAAAASAAGARTFTSTSSQGLLYMHEVLYVTSGLRLPVVMAVANRAISAPINIWNDQSDVFAERDTGWIQIHAESVQDVYDRMVQAYRIAEDSRVRLPVMVNYDGFVLSHAHGPVTIVADEEVAHFARRVASPFRLDPDSPISLGAIVWPDHYFEVKYQAARALEDSRRVIDEVQNDFRGMTGRKYELLRPYMAEDADFLLLAIGSVCGTIKTAARKMRSEGLKVGLIGLDVYRPFPGKELMRLIGGAKAVGVLDKAFLPGSMAGPAYTDVTSALCRYGVNVPVHDFVAGIGGRDIKVEDVQTMYRVLEKAKDNARFDREIHYVGLRR